ncbi:flagellar biosynthetic protein FliR [Buchnera aphidicola (Kurisakia onigurumii)]|uniref:flagellar biosynthetic protein FliR n=1 Tax=Buchnera aphidicola TaxID=9 RepID=UPI0031B70932
MEFDFNQFINFTNIIKKIILPIIRIISFFLIVPIFGDNILSKKIKIILSILIGISISPILPEFNNEVSFYEFFFLSIQQIIIGLFFGFIIRIIFSIPILSGEIISSQIGLSFANFFDLKTNINISIISRILNLFNMYIFLLLNGDLWLVYIICYSFNKFPIGTFLNKNDIYLNMILFFNIIFLKSLLLIFPIVIIMLSINFILAILNRISPQISIFSVFFPITVLIGLYSFYIFLPYFNNSFTKIFIKYLFLNIEF